MKLRHMAVVSFLWTALLPFAGCAPTRDDEAKPPTQDRTSELLPIPESKKEKKKFDDFQIIDLKVGEGRGAKDGDILAVRYMGTLKNGTEFDSNLKGAPFPFKLGANKVIAGWDEGLQGMKKGGKRKLIIPPGLGYGASGAGNKIPPYATLVFEIELLQIN